MASFQKKVRSLLQLTKRWVAMCLEISQDRLASAGPTRQLAILRVTSTGIGVAAETSPEKEKEEVRSSG